MNLLKGGKKKQNASMEMLRPTIEREYLITQLCHEMRDILDTTLAFNEKKAIQSYDERVKDEMDIEAGAVESESSSSEDEEGEKPIYNPLNLPLGWDGKPIPYWLYKLYGLVKSISVKYVETTVIGVDVRLIIISRNGDITMECAA